MRKIIIDEDGRERYKRNRIVRFILDDNRNMDMDKLWAFYENGMFDLEELKEFYQLIGYSIDGYDEIFEGK